MKRLVLILSLAFFVACSDEERPQETENIQNEKADGEFNMTLDGFVPFETDTIVLFEANNVGELNYHVDTTLHNFNQELEDIRAQHSNVDLILYNLTFNNNIAVVTDLYFLDTENEEVIDVFGTNSFGSPGLWLAVGDLLLGKCPDGWTSAGSYSTSNGIANATKEILTPGLQGNGDCVQIQYARGLLSVQICHRKC